MSLIKSKYLRRERSVQGENLFDDINTNSKNTLINLSLKQHRAKKNSMSFADSVLNTKKFGLSTNTSQNSSVHLEDFLNQKKHKKFITSFSNSLYNESIAQTTPSSEIEIRDITNKIPRGNKGTYINKNLSSKMKKILIETGDENLFNKKGGRKSMKVKEKIDKLTQGFIKERAMMVNRPVSDFKNEKDYGSYYQKISPLERRVNTLINCPSKSNKYKAELAFRNLNKRYVQKAKINLDGDEKRKEKEEYIKIN